MELLEIDAQGSKGLPGMTKLRAGGITEVRKMNGCDEDQVNETEEIGSEEQRTQEEQKK